MKKIYIGALAAVIVVSSIIFLNTGNSLDYVVTVDDEIAQLEAELLAVEEYIAAGTLTVEQATEAKVKILNRLEKINTSVSDTSSAKLSESQKQQLNDGLNRLKQVLVTYQSTLNTVDNQAIESKVNEKVRSKGGSSKLSTVIIDTIETVENVTEDVVEDYQPDESLDEQVDEIADEANNDSEETAEYSDEETASEDSEVVETDETTTDGENEAVNEEESTDTDAATGTEETNL